MIETGTKKITFMATSDPRRTSTMRSEMNSQTGLIDDRDHQITQREQTTRKAARTEIRGNLPRELAAET